MDFLQNGCVDGESVKLRESGVPGTRCYWVGYYWSPSIKERSARNYESFLRTYQQALRRYSRAAADRPDPRVRRLWLARSKRSRENDADADHDGFARPIDRTCLAGWAGHCGHGCCVPEKARLSATGFRRLSEFHSGAVSALYRKAKGLVKI